MLETVFEKIGMNYRYEDFAGRLERAKFWLEQCAPEQVNRLRKTRNFEVYNALDEDTKKEIAMLFEYLSKPGYTLDELNAELYAIPKRVYGEDRAPKELKALQGAFFKTVYKLLIDKEQGPRLYLFLYAINVEDYLPLLDFSHPQTEEEIALDEAAKKALEAPVEEKKTYSGEPDPVEPVKDTVELDAFSAVDLRVCKILKCQEIRKSHSCYKLTLDDGVGERVIVSSIKNDYKPEELIGKKIIVIANLKPTRITGVTSNGMLLAATNGACGCKVVFVDDAVPTGTMVK
jgi:lysyl-tRNA synthetase class 1